MNRVTAKIFVVPQLQRRLGVVDFTLITIGAIAVLYFSLSERLWTVKAGEDAPMSAKWVAALVLLSWAGVIMGGRLIGYV